MLRVDRLIILNKYHPWNSENINSRTRKQMQKSETLIFWPGAPNERIHQNICHFPSPVVCTSHPVCYPPQNDIHCRFEEAHKLGRIVKLSEADACLTTTETQNRLNSWIHTSMVSRVDQPRIFYSTAVQM
jgi:hypothetical protein